ncbi:MAG: hypothetical protein HY261_07145 [Chloroflexi bacterium]|nr:hypothetical protein [Chloroflexota bacterium]
MNATWTGTAYWQYPILGLATSFFPIWFWAQSRVIIAEQVKNKRVPWSMKAMVFAGWRRARKRFPPDAPLRRAVPLDASLYAFMTAACVISFFAFFESVLWGQYLRGSFSLKHALTIELALFAPFLAAVGIFVWRFERYLNRLPKRLYKERWLE